MKNKAIFLMILGIIWIAILGFIYFDSARDNLTKAEKTVNKFMVARMQSNQGEAEVFLSEKAKQQYSQPGVTLIGTSNPHFIYYKVMERKTFGDKTDRFQVTFVVRVFEKYSGEDDSSAYFEEILTVRRVNNNAYRIESVARGEYVNL